MFLELATCSNLTKTSNESWSKMLVFYFYGNPTTSVSELLQLPMTHMYDAFLYSVLTGRFWVTVGVWAIILTHAGDISGAALEGFVPFLEEDGGSLIETSIDGGMMTLCI